MKESREVIGFHADGVRFFESINAAAKSLGLNYSTIYRAIISGREIEGWTFNFSVQ